MPLKLSLKPGEKFVLNGAVLTNGDKRATLIVQNKACLLREKDIMQPDEATTPARRIYLPIMMMYLDCKPRGSGHLRGNQPGCHGPHLLQGAHEL